MKAGDTADKRGHGGKELVIQAKHAGQTQDTFAGQPFKVPEHRDAPGRVWTPQQP